MPTIRDVAKAAGVSVATVSRALNGSPQVTASTRSRVEAAVARLEYWPHGGARSLNTSRTHALGVLLPDLYGQFFSEVIRGLDQGASERGFQILISSSHAETRELLAAARTMRGRVDGLVVMAPDRASILEMERVAKKLPVVLINPHHEVTACSTISVANFEGAASLTRHLLERGHRAIAFLRGPTGNVDAEERLRGYRHSLRRARVRIPYGYELPGDFSEASGHRAAAKLRRLVPRPTAVFAANDAMALGLLASAREMGLEIPRDLAVVGFDDIAVAQYLTPPLTTVHLDAHRLGRRAIELLVDSLEGPPGSGGRHEDLHVHLVVRRSCGSNTARPRTRATRSTARAGGPDCRTRRGMKS